MSWEQLGMMAGGAAIGQIQGMLGARAQQKANDRNTRRQVDAQKELTDYNQQKALAMWKDTSYGAQKEQMKLAGLNPAMMYGMSGGGGQSAAVSAGSVAAGSAPSAGGEQMAGMQLGLQLGLLKAQKDNIEADTRNKNVTADKTSGVDTDLGRAQVGSLVQGVTNAKAAEVLMKIQARFDENKTKIAEDTYYEAVGQIVYESQKAGEELNQLMLSNSLDRKTMDDKVNIVRQESLKSVVDVSIAKAVKNKTDAEISKIKAEMDKWSNEVAIKWRELALSGRSMNNQEKQTFIQEQMLNVDRSFKDALIENGQWQNFINGAGSLLKLGPAGSKTVTSGPKGTTTSTTTRY
jgi:hypothetical protein